MNTISNRRALKSRTSASGRHDQSSFRRADFENDRLSAGDIIGAVACIALMIVALLLGGM